MRQGGEHPKIYPALPASHFSARLEQPIVEPHVVGAAPKLMDPDEFLRWQLDQESRFELVDGVPVEMMAGASRAHDTIVTNIIALLRAQLRGSGCFVGTADTAVRTKIRSIRRSDVIVTCDPPRPDVYEAIEPRLLVEVLPPSNVGTRWDRKMAEYRGHTKLDNILIVDSGTQGAVLHFRGPDGWDFAEAERPDDAIEMPKLGCRLLIRDIYEESGLAAVNDA
jgi:Uma2 family endonuclease